MVGFEIRSWLRLVASLVLVLAVAACSNTFEGVGKDAGKLFGKGGQQLSDADLRETQELLSLNGYRPGPIDGVVGPKTMSAIRAFQSDQGLPVTGQPSTDLLTRLRDVTSGDAPATATGN